MNWGELGAMLFFLGVAYVLGWDNGRVHEQRRQTWRKVREEGE